MSVRCFLGEDLCVALMVLRPEDGEVEPEQDIYWDFHETLAFIVLWIPNHSVTSDLSSRAYCPKRQYHSDLPDSCSASQTCQKFVHVHIIFLFLRLLPTDAVSCKFTSGPCVYWVPASASVKVHVFVCFCVRVHEQKCLSFSVMCVCVCRNEVREKRGDFFLSWGVTACCNCGCFVPSVLPSIRVDDWR